MYRYAEDPASRIIQPRLDETNGLGQGAMWEFRSASDFDIGEKID